MEICVYMVTRKFCTSCSPHRCGTRTRTEAARLPLRVGAGQPKLPRQVTCRFGAHLAEREAEAAVLGSARRHSAPRPIWASRVPTRCPRHSCAGGKRGLAGAW